MLCENHRPQESSQVQILDGHQDLKNLEVLSSGTRKGFLILIIEYKIKSTFYSTKL